MADYLLLSRKQELPPAGILGVSLEEKNGECRVRSLSPNGAGEKGGLTRGDVLVEIDGQTVKRISDVHLALWDRKPGDRVRVSVRRMRHFGAVTVRTLEIELTAPGKPQGD
ncbi:MAG: PDZ domain-containing protein [Bryobacteraceae bacterium]|jgi:S1-C subfamily serine protease